MEGVYAMIIQETYLRQYDWQVTLFYNAKPQNTSEIMRCLWRSGIAPENYWEAQRTLRSGRPNEGLTYNNPRIRSSVVVIGHVSDVWEWIDTIEHEGRHLVQGICNADGINPSSEEAAYMKGRIFKHIVKEFAYETGGRFMDAWRLIQTKY